MDFISNVLYFLVWTQEPLLLVVHLVVMIPVRTLKTNVQIWIVGTRDIVSMGCAYVIQVILETVVNVSVICLLLQCWQL